MHTFKLTPVFMTKPKEGQLIIPIHSTVVVLAPPSSGKRRFCQGISEATHSKILHVETGKLIRQLDDEEHNQTMSVGGLVDDQTAFSLTKEHIDENFDRHKHHFLFIDGFPRNEKQMEMVVGLAVGRIYLVQLKVHDAIVRSRFLNSLEDKDPHRVGRPDNTVPAFEKRLRDFRKVEPQILSVASRMGIPVFKRDISNTNHGAAEFHRIHIAGKRNLRPEGAHSRHH